MSPAQKRNRRIKLKAQETARKKLMRFGFGFLLLVIIYLAILIQTRFWQPPSKTFLVSRAEQNNINITIFDPELGKITNISIPGNTEVSVARQLGRWKLGSVWELGTDEGLEGQLLTETIIKFFKLPVAAWADEPSLGLINGRIPDLLKAVLLPYKTNLGFGDKVKMALFSAKIKNIKRENIDFSKGNILKKTTLIDGENGYLFSGSLPNYIRALFSNPDFSESEIRAVIYDASGEGMLAEEVGEVIEIMGAKLASIKKEEPADFDCEVSGRNRGIVDNVVKVFSCEKLKTAPQGNFDLEIKIGEKFAKRF